MHVVLSVKVFDYYVRVRLALSGDKIVMLHVVTLFVISL